MKSSFKLVSLFGIPVEIHVSFILFFVLFLPLGWGGVFFFVTVFSFVVLHELAHSLVAKAGGVPVERIVLIFFGGVANVEVPENPRLELAMASAGPAFNLVVVGLCFVLIHFSGVASLGYLDVISPEDFAFTGGHVLHTVMYVNLLLALFNIVPGFPMDGGRVLRAILALRMDYLAATQLSVSVGQQLIFPLLLVVGILDGNIILMVISFALFVTSGSELKIVKFRRAFRGLKVSDLANRNVAKVDGTTLVSDFILHLMDSSQASHYVVYGEGGRVLGVMDLRDVKDVGGNLSKPLSGFATQKYSVLDASAQVSDNVKDVLSADFMLVVSDKKVVGYLTHNLVADAYYRRGLKRLVS
ncbi:MAG: site-2 protease family protein [Candidatus Altiarchaeota archaeon]